LSPQKGISTGGAYGRLAIVAIVPPKARALVTIAFRRSTDVRRKGRPCASHSALICYSPNHLPLKKAPPTHSNLRPFRKLLTRTSWVSNSAICRVTRSITCSRVMEISPATRRAVTEDDIDLLLVPRPVRVFKCLNPLPLRRTWTKNRWFSHQL
jgi:hypothetical protein